MLFFSQIFVNNICTGLNKRSFNVHGMPVKRTNNIATIDLKHCEWFLLKNFIQFVLFVKSKEIIHSTL